MSGDSSEAGRKQDTAKRLEDMISQIDSIGGGKLRLGPNNPSGCAQEFIAEWAGERLVWRGDFYKYEKTHWAIEDEEVVKSEVNRELMNSVWECWNDKEKKFQTKEWNPNPASLAAVMQQLRLQAMRLPSDEPVRGGEYVFLENGRLMILTGALQPHDPAIFNLHAVPFKYVKTAECPEWDSFMHTTFAGDPIAIEIHYRWMAAELVGAVDLQKAYMLLGERRSGKGTLTRIGDALIGPRQSTAMSLRDFSKGFGLASLIGKTVCRINELVDAGAGAGAAVEYLLNIIGGDTVQLDRKNKDPWIGKLPVMFTLTGNELPRMPDSGGALVSRFILNRTVGSREGMQDPRLSARIIANEMPGVLNRVLDYVDKIEDTWPVNEAVLEDIEALRDGGSPVRAWLNDMGFNVGLIWCMPRADAYSAFVSWAHEHGHGRVSSATFGRHIKAAVPGLTSAQFGQKGSQVRYYVGFGEEYVP